MAPEGDLRTARGVVVPEAAITWVFARSTGAGGQNVNKTSSKATAIVATALLTGPTLAIARVIAAHPDEIRVTSQTSRSQWRNRQLCIERIIETIDEAAKPPPATRRKSRPSRGAVERRLKSKKHESEKKESRRTDDW